MNEFYSDPQSGGADERDTTAHPEIPTERQFDDYMDRNPRVDFPSAFEHFGMKQGDSFREDAYERTVVESEAHESAGSALPNPELIADGEIDKIDNHERLFMISEQLGFIPRDRVERDHIMAIEFNDKHGHSPAKYLNNIYLRQTTTKSEDPKKAIHSIVGSMKDYVTVSEAEMIMISTVKHHDMMRSLDNWKDISVLRRVLSRINNINQGYSYIAKHEGDDHLGRTFTISESDEAEIEALVSRIKNRPADGGELLDRANKFYDTRRAYWLQILEGAEKHNIAKPNIQGFLNERR